MKKSVRLCIAIVLLAGSLFFFLGKVIQFDFEASIRENMITEMLAEVTGDEDLIEEDISVKEAVDAAVEAIDDGMADDSMEEILDDNDDLEPIRRCGYGVAVSNALDCVKAAADEVAESNDEDGVARTLARLWTRS